MITREEMLNAMEVLQPVTPTDPNYPAHWWDSEFGKKVYNAQYLWIQEVKPRLTACKSSADVKKVLESSKITWPKYSTDPEENFEWWVMDFGAIIIACWKVPFNTFQQKIIGYDTEMR